MESTIGTTTRLEDLDSPGQVLAAARAETRAAEAAEARRLQLAVAWADQHPAESLEAAEVFRLRATGVGLETPRSQSPAPARRWSQSSVWPSSRPRSG